jgi:hypothetical protein
MIEYRKALTNMKPDPRATLIQRFSSREAAITFKGWATRLLKVGETMSVYTEPEHPLPGLYVLGKKGAKLRLGRLDLIKTAAAAFGWAWSDRTGVINRMKRKKSAAKASMKAATGGEV